MSGFKQVTEALAAGAEPHMICATCPWDRFCITPPAMSRQEVETELAKAKEQDEADACKPDRAGPPLGRLFATLLIGGADTKAEICPVFAARMRSSEGRRLVDGIRDQMLTWDDSEVSAVQHG